MLTGLLQDVKFGLRMMARSPWFTFVAVLTLALGIGVNTVGFSIANGVWWKRLPFRNPQEIVTIAVSNGAGEPDDAKISYPEFVDIRSRAHSFKNLAAIEQAAIILTNEGNASERYPGGYITPNLFGFLGAKPIRGRDFTPDDAKTGAPKVVLISHEVWHTRFGGREDLVGSAVRVDTVPATIVGIMPPGFQFPFDQKIWTPLVRDRNQGRNNRNLDVFARLAPGAQIQEARAEASGIAQTIARDHPDTNKGYDAVVLNFLNWVNGPDENTPVLMLFGAVGFILLIACGNAANLLLSRAAQRSREIAVRTAIGASRERIIRQVLVESVMLSLFGGILGLAFAAGGLQWFDYILRSSADAIGIPFWINFEIDYRVLAYFCVICIATGIGFGSVPAFQISKTNVNDNLKDGARQTTGGFRARRTATVLLVAEIAMTVVLLAESGLLMRGVLRWTELEIGIDTRQLVVADMDLPPSMYPKNIDRIAFVESFVERFKRPGRFATVAWAAPAAGVITQQLKLEDRDIADKSGKLPGVGTLPVESGYFPTLNVKLIRGRDFQASDGLPGTEVAIVNARFAAKYWPSENPIGKRLRLGDEKSPWLSVIGVSPDVFQTGNIVLGPGPAVYVPYRQNPVSGFSLLVRSADANAIAGQMRAEIAKMDPDLALYNVMTVDEMMQTAAATQSVFGMLFAILSLMALVMSSVGLYGVTAHGVNQRTQEIGIRAALGATQLGVVWLILKQSLKRIVAGLAFGLLGAALLSEVTKRVLYNAVEPSDPLTFLSVSLLLTTVTAMASFLPAWRAARLSPADALRME